MIFLNKHLTKWIPLGEFYFSSKQFVVLVRGNKKTGEVFFKTKRVNRRFGIAGECVNPIGKLDINTQQVWEQLQKELQ